ncbi:50S ribosomal protein L30e-like protein [Fimicolochytrium jonesii]|uniref:50S ribosomal protein L30e-like protein n=1 Tax=Fimicolochytrium jonesii TaxID=1396493 RepID=UPI0022FEEDE3|nr:50S ribosomal protein L30e-like protein [Fimicolochytrium jonesii]KAI8824074.1 50S ribosomal protein L30e-like protein [Fimicolochytrium jonesii]
MAKEKKDKTPKKAKSEAVAPATPGGDEDASAVSYETRVLACNPIAHPLASKKLTKKVLKTVKKAAKTKNVRRGVKEVVKAIRKGQKGVVVIAGDISPVDVITHVPVMCEEANVSYIYVPSKEELGNAGATKRATSVILVVAKDKKDIDYADLYEEVADEVKELNKKLITTV